MLFGEKFSLFAGRTVAGLTENFWVKTFLKSFKLKLLSETFNTKFLNQKTARVRQVQQLRIAGQAKVRNDSHQATEQLNGSNCRFPFSISLRFCSSQCALNWREGEVWERASSSLSNGPSLERSPPTTITESWSLRLLERIAAQTDAQSVLPNIRRSDCWWIQVTSCMATQALLAPAWSNFDPVRFHQIEILSPSVRFGSTLFPFVSRERPPSSESLSEIAGKH